jgi:DNA-binding transcriptional regulator YiaG
MATREQRVTAEVLVRLDDVRDRLGELAAGRDAHHARAALRRAVEDISAAVARLEAEVARGTGLSVEAAARYLDVSAPTVRAWTQRGVLARKPASKPMQVDRDSARRVHRALGDLRARGQDRDWMAALVDYLHDTRDRRSESVRRGLEELARGELEPA